MATKITDVGDDGEIQCSECEAIFLVVWHNNGWITTVEYCPFCGDSFSFNEPDNRD